MVKPAYLHTVKLTCAVSLVAATSFVTPVKAQVPGSFFPSVYGQAIPPPLPLTLEPPADNVPYFPGLSRQLKDYLQESTRPYIRQIFSYTNQSLVNRDNKLDTVTPGVEFGFFPSRQMQVQLFYLPTVFGLKKPLVYGHEYRAAVHAQPTDRFRFDASLGLFHTFHHVKPGLAVIGGSGASYLITDRIRVSAGYRRDIIGNSLLSATGLNLALSNKLVGRVKQNLFYGALNVRPTSKTVLDFLYGIGFDAGHSVQTNPFNQFNLYAGRALIARDTKARLQSLVANYNLFAVGYRRDLSGFGNLSLTPDPSPAVNLARLVAARVGQPSLPQPPGVNAPGVGGYFSPQLFFVNSFGLAATGRLVGSTYYSAGGSLGIQNFRSDTNKLNHGVLIGTANVSVLIKLTKHITIEPGWYFLQPGNTYRRNLLYCQTKYTF